MPEEGSQYEHSLVAMARLLEAVGEAHWLEWISSDLRQWRAARDTSHHLSAYGGMGSFNDVWICGTNGHRVSFKQEPWANILFNWMKSICHHLAQGPHDNPSALELSDAVGFHDASLSAVPGGDLAPDHMRGLIGADLQLQGWRCLQCGHAETSTSSLEGVVADSLLPSRIFHACEAQKLDRLVDQVLAFELPEAKGLRNDLLRIVGVSNIELKDRNGWMRPCPVCASDDTAVYRWTLESKEQLRLIPSKDNLPLKGKSA